MLPPCARRAARSPRIEDVPVVPPALCRPRIAAVLLEESKAFGAFATARASRPFSAWTCDPAPKRLRGGTRLRRPARAPGGLLPRGGARPCRPRAHRVGGLSDVPGGRRALGPAAPPCRRLAAAGGPGRRRGRAAHPRRRRPRPGRPVRAHRPQPPARLRVEAGPRAGELARLLRDHRPARRWTTCWPTAVGASAALQPQFTETIWYLPDTRLCFTPPDTREDRRRCPRSPTDSSRSAASRRCPRSPTRSCDAWARDPRGAARDRGCRLQNESLVRRRRAAGPARPPAPRGIDPARVDLHGFAPRAQYLRRLRDGRPPARHVSLSRRHDDLRGAVDGRAHPHARRRDDDRPAGRQPPDGGRPSRLGGESPGDYVARAVALAGDLPALAALRRELRDRVRGSPLFDAPRFARNLVDVLRLLWAEKSSRLDAGSFRA